MDRGFPIDTYTIDLLSRRILVRFTQIAREIVSEIAIEAGMPAREFGDIYKSRSADLDGGDVTGGDPAANCPLAEIEQFGDGPGAPVTRLSAHLFGSPKGVVSADCL